ncbi:pantothenate kinase 1-like isoform X3 [Primulina tabacum]|uniref:pantothenate kinase 1-like isoform X3 n=1 Tax=Primulina tabacum TaxID=48773 RepID=UPI003F5A85A5
MEGVGIQERKQTLDQVSHVALDIGVSFAIPLLVGTLIKVVYFSSSSNCSSDHKNIGSSDDGIDAFSGNLNYHLSGRLHFLKFETSKICECVQFISSKLLHHNGDRDDEKQANHKTRIKAVHHEAFTYMDGQKEYVQIDQEDLYPYLLVNIGSGVSMIKVESDSKFERVSGTSVGGGTFWGLGKLLTKCKSFDELLELSHQGNNRVIDMLVGDIYGGMDYSKIGLTSTAIASSFGKAISKNKELEDYRAEDVARSLLRMISNNIGQIAYLNALRFGLKRIFFGGFFIRGHAYTMDTISVAVHYWSKGEAKALFLCHEGFLGALGSFLSFKGNGFAEVMYESTGQNSSSQNNLVCTGDRIKSSADNCVKHYGCIECKMEKQTENLHFL